MNHRLHTGVLMKRCPACLNTYEGSLPACPRDGQALIDYVESAGTASFSAPRILTPEEFYVGKTLNNKFRIVALLGRGGMGAVYRAADIVLDRTVAVKLLRQDLIGSENLETRFLREARATARIEHPNAIMVYDFGALSEGGVYIVMEFIQGRTLRDLLKREGAVSSRRAVELMKQIAGAVAAGHKAGVIHRDLKPENIMLKTMETGPPVVKVVDFGLAKLKETLNQSGTNLTSKGEILGTPYYMSPEQCNGDDIDERTDIYSLGIIFYEMLLGRPPFQGMPAAVIGMHLYKAVPKLTGIDPTVPPLLEEIILKMLSKEKENRPARLEEVIEQIDQLSKTNEIASPFRATAESSLFPHKAETLQHSAAEAVEDSLHAPQSASPPRMPSNDSSAADRTLPVDEEQPTIKQNLRTIAYNSGDFRTRSSDTPTSMKTSTVIVGPSTTDLVNQTDVYRPAAPTIILPPAGARSGYKKHLFIGAAGLLLGAASVALLQPGSPPSIEQQPAPATVTGSQPAPNNAKPESTGAAKNPADSSSSAARPESKPTEKRPAQSDRKDQKNSSKRDDDDRKKDGVIKKVGKGFKKGFGLFGGKNKEKKEKKERD